MKLRSIVASIVISLLALGLFHAQPTHAYTNSRMIDDGVFDNVNSMTEAQIRSFINSRPNTCLTRVGAGLGGGNIFPEPHTYWDYGGNVDAARVVYLAAQYWGINPQVILATLQKEQSLLTDNDCLDPQGFPTLRKAMGHGCPEGGGCPGPAYDGFHLQVMKGAWQLKFNKERAYGNTTWDGDDNVFYGGFMTQGNRKRCGTCASNYYTGYATIDGQSTYLENGATAALYTFTPHLNQSFPRIFEQYFGPSLGAGNSISMQIVSGPDGTPARGQTVNYRFRLTNTSSVNITLTAVGIVGRAGSIAGPNRDFGWQGPVTLAPNDPQEFSFDYLITEPSTLYAWPAVNYQGIYTQYNNWGATLSPHEPNFTLSQPLTMSPSTVYAGQNVTFSAKLKNNEETAIRYDAIGIPVKFYNHYNYDAIWVGPGTVSAGAEVTLSGARNIDKPGPFTYWVSSYFAGTYSTIGAIKNFTSLTATPTFSVSGLAFENSTPIIGDDIEASFSITNSLPVSMTVDAVGVIGRLGTFSGPNRDIAWQGPVTFAAGETKTFSGLSRSITDVGAHHYWVGVYKAGYGYIQYNNWGSTVVTKTPSFSVSGLTFTSNSPTTGSSLGASFTVTNNLSVGVDVDAVGVVGRYGSINGVNRDLGWTGPVHFNAGETKSFSGLSRTIAEVGPHYYWIGVYKAGLGYLQYNNWGSTIVSRAP